MEETMPQGQMVQLLQRVRVGRVGRVGQAALFLQVWEPFELQKRREQVRVLVAVAAL